MMGRCAEGGCGTEERFCPISRPCSSQQQQQRRRRDGEEEQLGYVVGFHEQARKALGERSPFDSSEDGVVPRVSTLPTALADFLSKYSSHTNRHNINNKRHKKSHGGGGGGGGSGGGWDSVAQQPNHPHSRPVASNIWSETEEYFRPLMLSDVDNLAPSSSFGCFSIPPLPLLPVHLQNVNVESLQSSNCSSVEGGLLLEVVEKKKMDEYEQHCMDIDSGEKEILSTPTPSTPELSSGGLEWLLCSRNKIQLTSERPSKKRKVGSDAGLERLRVVHPYKEEQRDSLVCHLCCLRDTSQPSNHLLICDSCKVAVHQKCYGVQDLPVGMWFCSWCKYTEDCTKSGNDTTQLPSRPCLFCPKLGGALKPVAKDATECKISGPVKFVHLFCCQWMPEVYIEDSRTMEPVMNVKGIKETRKRLVCYLCKVKYGACIRCSHGTCRTSFHPICARESGHRMEIWGRPGCENVELRAFCIKHSGLQNISGTQQSSSRHFVADDSNLSGFEHLPVTVVVNKPNKLKIGRTNGQRNMVNVSTSEATSGKLDNSEILLEGVLDSKSKVRRSSEGLGAQLSVSMKTHEGDSNGDTLDFVQTLKKLVDRGKAMVSDVALEMGISSELLSETLTGDKPSFPDLHCKILKWLKNHAYMGRSQKNLKSGDCVAISPRARVAGSDGPNSIAVAGHDNLSATLVKPVSPRRMKSNMKFSLDNRVMHSFNGTVVRKNDYGIVIDESNMNSLVPNEDLEEHGTIDGPFSDDVDLCMKGKDGTEKILCEPFGHHDTGSPMGPLSMSEEDNQAALADVSVRDVSPKSNGNHPVSSVSVVTPAMPTFITGEPSPSSSSSSSAYIHPFIQKRLVQLQNGMFVKQENIPYYYGTKENDHAPEGLQLEQLVKARKLGILELSPEDEVEGQLIYFQNKLLEHAATSNHSCEELIFSIIKALPEELDATRKQRWDSVLVNQYLCAIREAKKQGRKEKRHKEAQAVLAAATAAAAASSRISSFRKDVNDETSHQEAPLKVMPRAKETLSRSAIARVSSEKPSGVFQLTSLSKENPQLCDICRRSETMLNPILVCWNCKVSVHVGCYRSVKEPSGPWYCELCEEVLLYSGFPENSLQEARVVKHCGLCGGTTGAFRKSTDAQWVHAFCAEWLLEATFRRGQPNLVEGMENISKETEICCICYRKIGSCIKCSFGNCQSTFHPSCARSSGLYMHLKTGGGKFQHRAYCEKHSLEQREKAGAQQHGPEELRGIKQIRVELERVRLLCERIIKREKLKRELVLCSHDILASKRDSVAFSVLVRSPFFLPDVSSESATTSLRGHVDDNRSCSEAMQRSEEITMDSAISGKRRVMLPEQLDLDQKTDYSSTSQHHCPRTFTDRGSFAGKQLPHRPVSFVSRNLTDDCERKSKSRKHTETFQKELVMTSDQASVQNQRLPKGFAYVPVLCLPKEKPANNETGSLESPEPDG